MSEVCKLHSCLPGLPPHPAIHSASCRYLIPGGSAGHFQRQGFTFDVGSSMMFGLGKEGTTNLITRALAAVGKSVDTAPDPTQIHYHLPPSEAHPEVRLLPVGHAKQPGCSTVACCVTEARWRAQGLQVKVWRDYTEFIKELTSRFPHDRAGIQKFYDECWRVFNALNSLELKSLEEPKYLLGGAHAACNVRTDWLRHLFASQQGKSSVSLLSLLPDSRLVVTPPRLLACRAGSHQPHSASHTRSPTTTWPACRICQAAPGMPHAGQLPDHQHGGRGPPPHQGPRVAALHRH